MKPVFAVAIALFACSATPAIARPDCTPTGLNSLEIQGLTITAAAPVDAAANAPSYCGVEAIVTTQGEGAPPGSARVAIQLPDIWQQRFLFMGVGGNAGTLTPAINATDRSKALGKGYVTAVTDTGHVGNGTDAGWVRTPDGKRDEAKVADFFYRAAHAATLAAKALAKSYYIEPIQYAYFDGCSTGGRMAMMEAERYPTDYDGIIAGDPNMDYHAMLQRFAVQKAAFASPAAWLSPANLATIDKIVTERCDGIDGVKDGLVQNPARCPVRAEDLACKPGTATDCLSPEQVAVLRVYTTPLRDRAGHIVFPGWAIAHLSGARGMSYWTTGNSAPNNAQPHAPWGSEPQAAPRSWTFAHEAMTAWFGMGPDAKMASLDVDPRTNVAGDALITAADRTFGPAETKNPAKLLPFIQQGRKMILYHGASDPALPAARTVQFYQELSVLLRGRDKAAANVRLFLVPGMQHCSGGIGPDQFDTLSALEAWVEHAKAPDAITARTKADATIVPHELPLCPYPRQAKFSGFGQPNDGANWQCADVDGKG